MWNLQFFLDLKKKCQRIFYAKINKLYKEKLDVRLFFQKISFPAEDAVLKVKKINDSSFDI